MRLYLIRHPVTLAPEGVCYGASDVEVAPQVREACLRRLLADASLPRSLTIYSSPLRRCAELAVPLAAALGSPPPVFDERLREMDFGAWELRPWEEIPRVDIDAWAGDIAGYQPGGGESALQMAQRVWAFRDSLLDAGEDACVVCHAGVIRLLTAMQGRRSAQEAVAEAAWETGPDFGSVQALQLYRPM